MLHCHVFLTLWNVLTLEMKTFVSSSRDDFDFVSIAVTCYCFARRKLNRAQNYFESTVHSNYRDEFATQAILYKWYSDFQLISCCSKRFQVDLPCHLHFNQLNPTFWLNGKCPYSSSTRLWYESSLYLAM